MIKNNNNNNKQVTTISGQTTSETRQTRCLLETETRDRLVTTETSLHPSPTPTTNHPPARTIFTTSRTSTNHSTASTNHSTNQWRCSSARSRLDNHTILPGQDRILQKIRQNETRTAIRVSEQRSNHRVWTLTHPSHPTSKDYPRKFLPSQAPGLPAKNDQRIQQQMKMII